MKKNIILCGLDDTLSNTAHRRHIIRPSRCKGCWDHSFAMGSNVVCGACGGTGYEAKPDLKAYEAACVGDSPIQTTIDLIKHLTGNMYNQLGDPEIWIVTGRSDAAERQTLAWLTQNLVSPSKYLMRRAGDETPEAELKRRWLQDGTIPRDRVFCAFDADDSVVKMWRSEGLICYQTVA